MGDGDPKSLNLVFGHIAQVESLLKTQETGESSGTESHRDQGDQSRKHASDADAPMGPNPLSVEEFILNGNPQAFCSNQYSNTSRVDDIFSWEVIELGLDEALPLQEVLDELVEIYFDRIHQTAPMIHKYRFLAFMNLSPNSRPPIALRYAMWTLAASITNKYQDLHEHFYMRARKYTELAEMTGHGEKVHNSWHTQAWILIAIYEFKMMHFPRAWLSTGRAIRLAQMMGMHRLDSLGLDVKQTLSPPRDWVEREERRRTFWMAFCLDTYATVGTGWPMTIDEKDILTNLPCSEEGFERSIETQEMSLGDAMTPESAANLSPFSGVVVVASLFRRTLLHLHRPDVDDREDDLNGDFWKRHRIMDNILLNTSLYLPPHLRPPLLMNNSNTIFLNLSLHAATICLHQVAMFKAEKFGLPSVSAESKVRCITAAAEVARVMRTVAHVDPTTMNPFVPFCLYIAARVLIQYVAMQPHDDDAKSSVKFLLSAIAVMKPTNPLADSFLVQLDVELEGIGFEAPAKKTRSYAGKQQCMADAFSEETDGSPWVKIVSPLVMIVEQTEDRIKPADGTSSSGPMSGVPSPSPFAAAGLSKEETFNSVLPHRASPARNISNPAQNDAGTAAKHQIGRPQQNSQHYSFSADSMQNYDQGTSNSTSNIASPTEGMPGTASSPFTLYTLASDGIPSGKVPTTTTSSTESYFTSDHLQTAVIGVAELSAQGQAYVPPNANAEEILPITQEAWEFAMMNVLEDSYDSLMAMGPTDWESPAQ